MVLIRTSSSPLHPDVGGAHPRPSEITPKAIHDQRRAFMRQGLAWGAGAGLASLSCAAAGAADGPSLIAKPHQHAPLNTVRSPVAGAMTMDKLTSYEDVSTYNNFYEFGTDKSDPAEAASSLRTRGWTLRLDGEVERPQTLGLEELLRLAPLEDRIYRLRCVEGWSMVIPWVGYSLATLIKRAQPTSRAKYVEFSSLADPQQMPGVRSSVLDWPYVEGLRMDEAMHPLTLLGLGLYGEVLPNQNGAPVRVVVPWKYGFKSAKSIVRIRLVERQPATAWVKANAHEYGFYSNVNPQVDHPRWSQASERRIGESGLFAPRHPTLMFNGYGAQVASMYAGMDLRANF